MAEITVFPAPGWSIATEEGNLHTGDYWVYCPRGERIRPFKLWYEQGTDEYLIQTTQYPIFFCAGAVLPAEEIFHLPDDSQIELAAEPAGPLEAWEKLTIFISP